MLYSVRNNAVVGIYTSKGNFVMFVTLLLASGAVYCNRSSLFVGGWVSVCVCGWVGLLP